MIRRREPVPPKSAEERVAAVLTRTNRFVPIVIPGTDTKARMRLLTAGEEGQLANDLADWMVTRSAGSDRLEATALMPTSSEEARRRIAIAVRRADADEPLATLSQWMAEADDDQVAELWHRYHDLRAELDPMSYDLPADEMAAITQAVKKKDETSLRRFGARQLRAWLLSTASPPTDSPTPKSSGGPE